MIACNASSAFRKAGWGVGSDFGKTAGRLGSAHLQWERSGEKKGFLVFLFNCLVFARQRANLFVLFSSTECQLMNDCPRDLVLSAIDMLGEQRASGFYMPAHLCIDTSW